MWIVRHDPRRRDVDQPQIRKRAFNLRICGNSRFSSSVKIKKVNDVDRETRSIAEKC